MRAKPVYYFPLHLWPFIFLSKKACYFWNIFGHIFANFSSSSKWDVHDWTKEIGPIEYSAKWNAGESKDYIDFEGGNL